MLALVGVLGGGAVAIAAQGNRPDTDEVEAAVVFTHVEGNTKFCEGEDGPYGDQLVHATGTSVGDPRLTGRVDVRIRVIVNGSNGVGIERGHFSISDPATGRKKVEVRLYDSGVAEITQGVLVGRVLNPRTNGTNGPLAYGELIANFRVTFHETGAVTMQIGGVTTDGRIPAVVREGHCPGPTEHFEADLPTATATATARGPRGSGPVLRWAR